MNHSTHPHPLKTDQHLQQLAYRYLYKLHFIQFLKNTKLQTTEKIYLINTYYHILKHSLSHFLQSTSTSSKRHHLIHKIKTFKCSRFFNSIRLRIDQIKNPSQPLTTAHAYLHYFSTLRRKFFEGMKLNFNYRKHKTKQLLLLMSIKQKIDLFFIYNPLRKAYHSKFFNYKALTLQKHITINKLLRYSRKQIAIDESIRMWKRYIYINIMKYGMKHFSLTHLHTLKQVNDIERRLKALMCKRGIHMIKQGISRNKSIYESKIKFYNNICKKLFFNNIRKRICMKMCMMMNINKLHQTIRNVVNNKTLKRFKETFLQYMHSDKVKEIRYYNKQSLYKLLHYTKMKVKYKQQIAVYNKYYYDTVMNMVKVLINNVKMFKMFRENNVKARKVFVRNIMKKIICGMKGNVQQQKHKRTVKEKCDLVYERMLKRKGMKMIGLYREYLVNKRNQKMFVLGQRREVIAKHVIEKIIVMNSRNMHVKEELIAKEYVDKSTKGIRTALMWFNKLKTRVMVKKGRSLNGNEITNQISDINVNTNNNNKIRTNNNSSDSSNTLLNDLAQLKALRNKKRTAPKKFDFTAQI